MNAIAQSLPPVAQSSGIDWFLLLGIAAIVGAVALFVWYKRKNPAAASAAGTVISADAAHVGSVISAEFVKLRELLSEGLNHAIAAAPAPTAEPTAPAVPVPAGKNGQAGPITFNATGDPKADTAAFNALYFG